MPEFGSILEVGSPSGLETLNAFSDVYLLIIVIIVNNSTLYYIILDLVYYTRSTLL